MAQHSADDWLTTTPQRSGLDDDPLRVPRWHVVFEAADLLLLIVEQPTLTLLGWVSINKWAVLDWHADRLNQIGELSGLPEPDQRRR